MTNPAEQTIRIEISGFHLLLKSKPGNRMELTVFTKEGYKASGNGEDLYYALHATTLHGNDELAQ